MQSNENDLNVFCFFSSSFVYNGSGAGVTMNLRIFLLDVDFVVVIVAEDLTDTLSSLWLVDAAGSVSNAVLVDAVRLTSLIFSKCFAFVPCIGSGAEGTRRPRDFFEIACDGLKFSPANVLLAPLV